MERCSLHDMAIARALPKLMPALAAPPAEMTVTRLPFAIPQSTRTEPVRGPYFATTTSFQPLP